MAAPMLLVSVIPLSVILPRGAVGDVGTGPLPGQDGGPGAGHRPLGGGGALASVLQGVRYCRSAVQKWEETTTAAHSPKPPSKVMEARARPSPWWSRPRRARKGDVLPPGGEGGADALVEQVAGKEPVHGGGSLAGLVQRQGEGPASAWRSPTSPRWPPQRCHQSR